MSEGLSHGNDNLQVAACAGNGQGIGFVSVCSGIEAASVAWGPLGWRAVAVAEIEKFPSAVLAHHYPDVPNLGDFTKINTRKLGRVDVLCGGTPCQAFSIAGLRNSLADARGNLTLAFVELAHELAGLGSTDGNGLRNAVWENVPGVLSTKDNAFGCFLGALVGADDACVPVEPKPADGKSSKWWRWSAKERTHAVKWPRYGMVVGPKGRAAWAVKDAQFFGLAQRRERVLLVADFGNGADPFKILFEPEGVRRDTPPSREAGQGVAGTIAGGARKSGGYSHDDVPLTAAYAPEIARCVATREGSSQDYESTTMVATCSTLTATYGEQSGQDMMAAGMLHVSCVTGAITHALTAEGHDASEDGSGRRAPIVCVHGTQDPCTSIDTAFALGRNSGGENVIAFSAKDYGADATLNPSPTLRAGGHTGSHANAGVMPAICFDTTQITSKANRSNPKAGDPCHPLSAQAHPPAVAWSIMPQNSGKDYKARQVEVAQPLMAGGPVGGNQGGDYIQQSSAVRRLTPKECERLQGFPDDYTNIPWRGKLTSPDGPRYKALGNSWAVPKFRWLGERIQRFMPANDNAA